MKKNFVCIKPLLNVIQKIFNFYKQQMGRLALLKLILMPAIENHDLNNFTAISLSVGFKLKCTK